MRLYICVFQVANVSKKVGEQTGQSQQSNDMIQIYHHHMDYKCSAKMNKKINEPMTNNLLTELKRIINK